MNKIKLLLLSVLAAMVMASPSFAQTSTSTSTGTGTATAGNSENNNIVNVTSGGSGSSGQQRKRNPVSSASAPGLVTSEDTCMGSSSAGAQAIGFGLSVGSTWKDEDCIRRKDARELRNMGYKPAAIALMCQNRQVNRAMKAAGSPCVVYEDEKEQVATHSYVPSRRR